MREGAGTGPEGGVMLIGTAMGKWSEQRVGERALAVGSSTSSVLERLYWLCEHMSCEEWKMAVDVAAGLKVTTEVQRWDLRSLELGDP